MRFKIMGNTERKKGNILVCYYTAHREAGTLTDNRKFLVKEVDAFRKLEKK